MPAETRRCWSLLASGDAEAEGEVCLLMLYYATVTQNLCGLIKRQICDIFFYLCLFHKKKCCLLVFPPRTTAFLIVVNFVKQEAKMPTGLGCQIFHQIRNLDKAIFVERVEDELPFPLCLHNTRFSQDGQVLAGDTLL